MEEVRKRRQLKPEEKLQIYKEVTVARAQVIIKGREQMLKCLISVLLVMLMGLPLIAGADTYDISGDFSKTTNPNGVWSYGRLDALDGTFTAYSNTFSWTSGGTIDVWNDPNYQALLAPSVWNNASSQAFVYATVVYLTGWAGFHPGPDWLGNALSDYRFTAPDTSMYSILADFQGTTLSAQQQPTSSFM